MPFDSYNSQLLCHLKIFGIMSDKRYPVTQSSGRYPGILGRNRSARGSAMRSDFCPQAADVNVSGQNKIIIQGISHIRYFEAPIYEFPPTEKALQRS